MSKDMARPYFNVDDIVAASTSRSLVILTGAGLSVESGLKPFRGDGDGEEDGLWEGRDPAEVATVKALRDFPWEVRDFVNERRAELKTVEPNTAHIALAELAEKWPGRFLLVTQNCDDLHERALEGRKLREGPGGFKFIHMHGEYNKVRCTETGEVYDWKEDVKEDTVCECCGKTGTLRPHVVLFGEQPMQLEAIQSVIGGCDLFVAIGTSGNVNPAADFVRQAKKNGWDCKTVEINPNPTDSPFFDEQIDGKATVAVPEFVERILAEELGRGKGTCGGNAR